MTTQSHRKTVVKKKYRTVGGRARRTEFSSCDKIDACLNLNKFKDHKSLQSVTDNGGGKNLQCTLCNAFYRIRGKSDIRTHITSKKHLKNIKKINNSSYYQQRITTITDIMVSLFSGTKF